MSARKFSIAIVVLALCGALAMAGISMGATVSKVTIQGGGGEYFGYVKSEKRKCKSNRKVKLFKQLGSRPSRARTSSSTLTPPSRTTTATSGTREAPGSTTARSTRISAGSRAARRTTARRSRPS